MAKAKMQYLGTGRRKCSVARVRLLPGTGNVTINKKSLDDYFEAELLKQEVMRPFAVANCEGKFDVIAIVQGGGSYAKMVNNILCFGGEFPGEENTMHQADEKFCIESFMKMARIYARAIYSLCCE